MTVLVESDYEEFARLFAQAPDIVQQEMYAATLENSLLIEREVKERTPKGSNHALSKSITAHEPQVWAGGVIGMVGTTLGYALAVEEGSKPHMPPIVPLVDWAMDVLGLDEWEAKEVAWGIAMMIKKFGTEGKFMFRDAWDVTEDQVKARFGQALEKIKTRLAE